MSVRQTLSSGLAALVITAGFAQIAQAQRGEDIAKGLLRALIESQLERSNRREPSPPADPFRPPENRPQPSAEIRQLRPVVQAFAQESASLAALLNSEARRNPDVRRYLADAIRLQASATALQRQTDTATDVRSLADGFRQLNGDWQTLAHQLQSLRGLSNQVTAVIGRLNDLDRQYRSLLGIQEQIDADALVRTAYTLAGDLRTLSDEVDHVAVPAGTSRQLPYQLRKLRQEAEFFASLMNRSVRHQTAVAEYQQLYTAWQNLEPDLSRYTDRSVVRATQRVRDSHRSIHQLLRLSQTVDRGALLHLVHEVDHELTRLAKTLTLEDLMNLPDGDAVPEAADTAFGTVQNLDDIIHREESAQAIAEAWVYADESLKLLDYYLQAVPTAAVRSQLRSISQNMQSLRDSLGITVEYDRHALVQSVSSLEALAEHLVQAIQRWQSQASTVPASLLNQANSLVARCHELEQSLLRNRSPDQLRKQVDDVVVLWQQIRPELRKSETDARETLDHIAASFTPELIRIRTLLHE